MAWNGNETRQWTTNFGETEGCLIKIYYHRDIRRCLKRHALIFIGHDRARQHFYGIGSLIDDHLLMQDFEINKKAEFKSKELDLRVEPIQEGTTAEFSTWLKFYQTNVRADVRNVANKVIRYSTNSSASNLERKVVFIHPERDLATPEHLTYSEI